MSALKEKLQQAVDNFNQTAQQYQQLQEKLTMLKGSIETLSELVQSEEQEAEAAAKAETQLAEEK